METWSKRISALTFGNGRKLISPHRNASANVLFIISFERICSRLCCEDSPNESGRREGGSGLRAETSSSAARRNYFFPMLLCTNRTDTSASSSSNLTRVHTFQAENVSKPTQMRMKRRRLLRDPSLCFHIDIKPSIRGLLSPRWQPLGCRLWHTFNS